MTERPDLSVLGPVGDYLADIEARLARLERDRVPQQSYTIQEAAKLLGKYPEFIVRRIDDGSLAFVPHPDRRDPQSKRGGRIPAWSLEEYQRRVG